MSQRTSHSSDDATGRRARVSRPVVGRGESSAGRRPAAAYRAGDGGNSRTASGVGIVGRNTGRRLDAASDRTRTRHHGLLAVATGRDRFAEHASRASGRDRTGASTWRPSSGNCTRLSRWPIPRPLGLLDQLDQIVAEASSTALQRTSVEDRTLLLRRAFALERRLAVWRSVHQLARPVVRPVAMNGSSFDAATMSRHVRAVEDQLARLDNAATWRKYLLLDEVRQLEAQHWTARAEQRSRLAREILTRLDAANATVEQQQFFAAPAWQEFTVELRKWVVEPVDYESLLDDLERLEETGLEDSAQAVAESYQLLRWSSSPPMVELADHLNTYYRNANIRVAISADLVNRLLPHPQTVDENVDDTLMGGRIFGRSRVSTRLRLVLFPDRQQWKMGLEAEGQVDSRTETKRGPAIFHNAGRAQYLARKLLMLDDRGLRTEEAEAAAVSDADLTKLETDLDGVPLVNLLVRAIARQQYDSKADAAKWEAEGLLANRAQSRLDAEVDKQLRQSTEKFRTQILEPLQDLGLRPEAVDMETTQERLIARYRLAGNHQVGACTPRPQATSDSLLSVQIHETALNNVMSSLQLGGQDTDLPSLFREIARRFRQDELPGTRRHPDRRDHSTGRSGSDPLHLLRRSD